jgi:hypothetical protein
LVESDDDADNIVAEASDVDVVIPLLEVDGVAEKSENDLICPASDFKLDQISSE